MKVMKLRLVSNGTGGGTNLFDTETGAILPASKITWSLDMNDGHRGLAQATATILIRDIEIEQEMQVEEKPVPALPRKDKA